MEERLKISEEKQRASTQMSIWNKQKLYSNTSGSPNTQANQAQPKPHYGKHKANFTQLKLKLV